MHTVVIGVRHKSAPIEIREKLAFSEDAIPDALREMLTYSGILECAILNTCNRTEIYATVTDTEIGVYSLKRFLREYKQFDYNQHMTYAFILLHEDAIMHLFRVASGVDSLILGEGQIMAQVKESLKCAMLANTSGEMIEQIFKTALSVGKSVRSQTGIANRDISVSRAAFEFALTNYPDFVQGKIALIGAGKMAEILLSSLKSALGEDAANAERVALVNRTMERSKALSQRYGFPGYGWGELELVLQEYDTLFVATSSPHYVLYPELFERITTPKLIIDISVPRNVDPEVGKIPGVSLYNTDNLSGYSGYSGENRLKLIHQAHQIIEQEYVKYHQWFMARFAAPLITQLRSKVETIRRHEVAEIQATCPHIGDTCDIIDELSRAIVNKILHDPTVQLRSALEPDELRRQAEVLSRIFNFSDVGLKQPYGQVVQSEPLPQNILPFTSSRK